MKRPEEKHMPILQLLESTLATFYRATPTLTDYDVAEAYDALAKVYKAETTGRAKPEMKLKGKSEGVYQHLHAVAEIFLGRTEKLIEEDTGEAVALEELIATSAEDMLECFKRLQSSLKLWTKEGGRQGYLIYISQFV
jgi:hypothetical protein